MWHSRHPPPNTACHAIPPISLPSLTAPSPPSTVPHLSLFTPPATHSWRRGRHPTRTSRHSSHSCCGESLCYGKCSNLLLYIVYLSFFVLNALSSSIHDPPLFTPSHPHPDPQPPIYHLPPPPSQLVRQGRLPEAESLALRHASSTDVALSLERLLALALHAWHPATPRHRMQGAGTHSHGEGDVGVRLHVDTVHDSTGTISTIIETSCHGRRVQRVEMHVVLSMY